MVQPTVPSMRVLAAACVLYGCYFHRAISTYALERLLHSQAWALRDESRSQLTHLCVGEAGIEACVCKARWVLALDGWHPEVCRTCVETDGEVLARVAK